MLSHLLFLSMAIGFTFATPPPIFDHNCTVDDKGDAYTEGAFACENKMDDAYCALLFAIPVPNKPGSVTERKLECFGSSASVLVEDIKNAAISICPKTCGYCCQTPEYNCKNSGDGMDCNTITPEQCKDPKWREVIAVSCPNKCGLCNEAGCVDAVIECGNDPSICRNVNTLEFAMKNCKKTCGYCDLMSTTPAGGITGYTQNPAGCSDTSPSCSAWMKSGFCSSPFYTMENKKRFCQKTCGLC